MYGWILTLFKEYLLLNYPEKQWVHYYEACHTSRATSPIAGKATSSAVTSSSSPHPPLPKSNSASSTIHRQDYLPDHEAKKLLRYIINDLSLLIEPNQFLEEIGEFYLLTLINQGYDPLLRCLGNNLEEWFANLNKIHTQLEIIYTNITPPEFWCVEFVDPTLSDSTKLSSPEKHEYLLYYTSQKGHSSDIFLPIICGLVRAILKEYFALHLQSMKLQSTQDVTSPHTCWKLTTVPLNSDPKISARKYTQNSPTPRSARCPFLDLETNDVRKSSIESSTMKSSNRYFFPSKSPNGAGGGGGGGGTDLSSRKQTELSPPCRNSLLSCSAAASGFPSGFPSGFHTKTPTHIEADDPDIKKQYLSASQISGILATDETVDNPSMEKETSSPTSERYLYTSDLRHKPDLESVVEYESDPNDNLNKPQDDPIIPKPERTKTPFISRLLKLFRSNGTHHKLVPVSPKSSGCPTNVDIPAEASQEVSMTSRVLNIFKRQPSIPTTISSPSKLTHTENLFLSVGVVAEQVSHLYPFHILFDIHALSILSMGLAVSEYVKYFPTANYSLDELFNLQQPKNLTWELFQQSLEHYQREAPPLPSLVITVISKQPSLRCPTDHRPQGFKLTGQVILSQYSNNVALFLAYPHVISIPDMLSQGLSLFDLEKYPLAQSLLIQSELMKLETQLSFQNEKDAEVLIKASKSLANEMKSVAIKAEEALDVKKIFVRTVSHEIRTPLTVAKMGLSLLEKDFNNYVRVTHETTPRKFSSPKLNLSLDATSSSPRTQIALHTNATPTTNTAPTATVNVNVNATPAAATATSSSLQIKESIQDIQLSIETAINILNDLLAYEKLESGILVTYKSLQPVQSFILDAIRPFRLQATEKSIKLQVEDCHEECFNQSGGLLKAEDMLLHIDDKKMSQVIRNLLSNAIKFTPEGGTVIIKFQYSTDITTIPKLSINIKDCEQSDSSLLPKTTSDDDIEGLSVEINGMKMMVQRRGTLTMEFIDSGAGITTENQKKLFKQIIQFSPDKLQGGGGSGLGLWISSGIIDLHGGRIGVWSAGLGHGTTFYFSLPLYAYVKDRKVISLQRLYTIGSNPSEEEEDNPEWTENNNQILPPARPLSLTPPAATSLLRQSTPTPTSPIKSPFHNLKVLVVDDVVSIRKVMMRSLQSVGCQCDLACDGQSAIDKVKQKLNSVESYDLILMDGIMAPMNGLDATREIIKLGYPGLIFGATGNVMPDDIQQFLDAGAHDVLAKPLSLNDLEISLTKHTRTSALSSTLSSTLYSST